MHLKMFTFTAKTSLVHRYARYMLYLSLFVDMDVVSVLQYVLRKELK